MVILSQRRPPEVLSFLQQGLERRLSPSTLKVYVAAIAANHSPVEGKLVGKHDWVIRFLRGVRKFESSMPPPPPPHPTPLYPFERLQAVELKFLSMKTLLLLALASIKKVGDLHAFSVDDSCLEFGLADSHIILRPQTSYVSKVPTSPFRDQSAALGGGRPSPSFACPIRALRCYVDRTRGFRTSD